MELGGTLTPLTSTFSQPYPQNPPSAAERRLECTRLAGTIRRWDTEVLAYSTSDGLSNSRSEAVNALIKKIKRVGPGFRNLDNYRLRLLLHTGGVIWHDQPAAKLRRRRPHLVA